jgi:hypothetical protein
MKEWVKERMTFNRIIVCILVVLTLAGCTKNSTVLGPTLLAPTQPSHQASPTPAERPRSTAIPLTVSPTPLPANSAVPPTLFIRDCAQSSLDPGWNLMKQGSLVMAGGDHTRTWSAGASEPRILVGPGGALAQVSPYEDVDWRTYCQPCVAKPPPVASGRPSVDPESRSH